MHILQQIGTKLYTDTVLQGKCDWGEWDALKAYVREWDGSYPKYVSHQIQANDNFTFAGSSFLHGQDGTSQAYYFSVTKEKKNHRFLRLIMNTFCFSREVLISISKSKTYYMQQIQKWSIANFSLNLTPIIHFLENSLYFYH